MHYMLEVCLIALSLSTGITRSVAAPSAVAARENTSFAGNWEGSVNDLPGINLKIQEAGRNTIGTIIFYFQERGDRNGPWHVAGESAVPLLAPNVEGQTLVFEVQHQRCHGCPELTPKVKFRMGLDGSREARLWNLDEGPDSSPVRRTEIPADAAQAMQKGISVRLPVTSNAVSMPDADQEGALIVSVTEDGSVYLGVDPISPAGLAEKVEGGLSGRAEKELFIKTDGRAPFAKVVKVLEAVRTAGVEAPDLLTAQQDSLQPGALAPPKGLEVLLGPPLPSGADVIVVQALNSGQQWPILMINNEYAPWTTLQSTLRQLFQNRSKKVVLVKAEGPLPFAHVVHVIDMCRSTGASVFLVTQGALRSKNRKVSTRHLHSNDVSDIEPHQRVGSPLD